MGRTCGTYGGEERCIQGFRVHLSLLNVIHDPYIPNTFKIILILRQAVYGAGNSTNAEGYKSAIATIRSFYI
jgi:hypothetical protein